MSKTSITRLFAAAVVADIAGVVISMVAVLAALAGGAIVIGGPQVIAINGGAFAWPLVWVVIGLVVSFAGTVAGIVSWLGALANTYRLEDKTWFLVVLVLGLFSFGLVAMIAYVFAGPDGTREGAAPNGTSTSSATTLTQI